MNLASFIILLLVAAAVWFAVRTLRRNGGHSCGECSKCGGACHCHRK